MRVEGVVFDIGNVLIGWQPEMYYDGVIGKDRREALFGDVDLHGMNEKVDRGEPFKDTIYATAEAHPEWADEIRMWHDNWLEIAQPEIAHSVALLRGLRANKVPVFALSNFGKGSFEIAQKAYPFLIEFDRRFISGYLGVTKPGPEIYKIVENDCGFAPETLLFTDDRLDNIATAAGRGWQVHHFSGPRDFAIGLVGRGLLSLSEAGL